MIIVTLLGVDVWCVGSLVLFMLQRVWLQNPDRCCHGERIHTGFLFVSLQAMIALGLDIYPVTFWESEIGTFPWNKGQKYLLQSTVRGYWKCDSRRLAECQSL